MKNQNIDAITSNIRKYSEFVKKNKNAENTIVILNIVLAVGALFYFAIHQNYILMVVCIVINILLMYMRVFNHKSIENIILFIGCLMMWISIQFMVFSLILLNNYTSNYIIHVILVVSYLLFCLLVFFRFYIKYRFYENKNPTSQKITMLIPLICAPIGWSLTRIIDFGPLFFLMIVYSFAIGLTLSIQVIVRYVWIKQYNIEV